MILPYINTRLHIKPMMERYDAYAALYNAQMYETDEIHYRKKTLKTTHRELFNDLVMELGKNMLNSIKSYEKIQREQGETGSYRLLRNPLCGEGFFVCITNRYQLAKHSRKELSTIGRNLNRLAEAGIIVSKIGHGAKNNFELHVNADFLLISDKARPEYNPLEMSDRENFFNLGKNATCKEDKILQEQLINKIYSDVPSDLISPDSENQSQQENISSETANQSQTAGALTGTEGKVEAVGEVQSEKRSFKATGGAIDVQFMHEDRGYNYRRFSSDNPAQWHAYHRLSHSASFIDYLIERIYSRRGVHIIPEARIRLIEYAEKFYFPDGLNTAEHVKTIYKPCVSMEDYATRLTGLKWCIDAANRYTAKKNGFFVLPNLWIDLQNPNGLTKTHAWYRESRKNEKDRAVHVKNIKDLRQLHEQIRKVVESPDPETYRRADEFVENHLAKYIWVFRANVTTILKKYENELDTTKARH